MDKFLYLISEGLKNVWRHKMTTFTAVFSLFLALYFVGLLATAGENTKSILQYLRSKYKIEVFFKQNIDLKAAKEVSDLIPEIKGVRSSTVINKDDAVRIFKDQFGEDILGILGYNPLPVSAVVNLKRNSEEVLDATPIVNKIKKMNGVEEVKYQGHLIKKIERTYARVMKIFPWVALVFISVAVLVIYNTVKLSIFAPPRTNKFSSLPVRSFPIYNPRPLKRSRIFLKSRSSASFSRRFVCFVCTVLILVLYYCAFSCADAV